MTLSPSDKAALSEIRFEKATEFLDDARANFGETRLRTATNRSYYAALSAARALLILEGVDPDSHSGAITALGLRFVKPGLLPAEVTKNLKLLLSRRTEVDYGDFGSVDTPEASDSLKKAETILEQIDAIRRKLIAELPR
jgi:uncharacterized protein (UPF0332 family)